MVAVRGAFSQLAAEPLQWALGRAAFFVPTRVEENSIPRLLNGESVNIAMARLSLFDAHVGAGQSGGGGGSVRELMGEGVTAVGEVVTAVGEVVTAVREVVTAVGEVGAMLHCRGFPFRICNLFVGFNPSHHLATRLITFTGTSAAAAAAAAAAAEVATAATCLSPNPPATTCPT
ncbi:unnamed protein product [Closterium sp. Naga37s-1]|nr:unnamed protein product [Closterium sp. Naga37s-1]